MNHAQRTIDRPTSERGWGLTATAGAVTLLALSGCSGAPNSAAPVAAPVTVTAPAQTVTAPAVTVTASSTPSASSAPPATEATAVSATVVVPDGVGKNYQLAQDLWRAAGLVVLPAKDALGANRLPVLDSNWVVLAQSPAAGSSVPRSTGVTATVKKYTDK